MQTLRRLRPLPQAELSHVSRQRIGQLLPLEDDRVDGLLPGTDQTLLLKEPGIEGVQEQFSLHRRIDDGQFLSRYLSPSAQVSQEFGPPGVQRLAYGRSPVNGPVTQLLYRPFQGGKPVGCARCLRLIVGLRVVHVSHT